MNDWRCILYYDNTQHVMEVRINDVVSEEVPKYGMMIALDAVNNLSRYFQI